MKISMATWLVKAANNKNPAPKKKKELTEDEKELEKIQKAIDKEKNKQAYIDTQISGLKQYMQHDMQVEMDPNQAYSGSEKAKAKEINKLMRQQNESLAKAQEYEEQKTKILQKLVKESEK